MYWQYTDWLTLSHNPSFFFLSLFSSIVMPPTRRCIRRHITSSKWHAVVCAHEREFFLPSVLIHRKRTCMHPLQQMTLLRAHKKQQNKYVHVKKKKKQNYHLNFKTSSYGPVEESRPRVIEYKLDHCWNYRVHLSVSPGGLKKKYRHFFIIGYKSKGLEDVFAFEILIIYVCSSVYITHLFF